MGSFGCKCGDSFHDGSDYVSYKARLIADQDFEDFQEASAASQVYAAYKLVKAIVYQCPSCSRLHVMVKGRTHTFFPDDDSPNILTSVKGEGWRRILIGSWSDKKKEGQVWWGDSSMGEGDHGFVTLTTREDVEKLYYEVFQRLSSADKLRSAFLRINGGTPQVTDEHSWQYTSESE